MCIYISIYIHIIYTYIYVISYHLISYHIISLYSFFRYPHESPKFHEFHLKSTRNQYCVGLPGVVGLLHHT